MTHIRPMRSSSYFLAIIAAAMLTLTAMAPQQAQSEEVCLDDWAKAAAIVRQNEMSDIATLSTWAHEKYKGRIMSARLCENGGDHFYRLVIQDDNGRMHHVRSKGTNRGQ